jgi:hypothetical protein
MPNHKAKTFNRIRKLTTIEEFTPETIESITELEELQYELIHTRLIAGTLANPIPFPDQLPYGFRAVGAANVMSKAYLGTQSKSKGLLVMASLLILEDKAWYHVSFSRENSLPTYADLKLIRKHWFGDLWAIQIFPPESEHVNIADFCLHLWHCLDEFPMPKFSVEGHI